MTTQSWNTPLSHASDAAFRTWGSELNARLAAIGLVQTADTGQVNWATVVRAGTNAVAGYEIWRFNDTLQGTAPIFLKLEYGTASATDRPQMWITVATGSNGSGTLTGQSSTRTICSPNAAIVSTVTNYPSYACAVDGAAWVVNKVGALGANIGFGCFAIVRTCDSTGAATTTGFVVYTRNTSNSATAPCDVQAVRTAATAQTFTLSSAGYFSMIVHGITSSLTGSDAQAFLHWMPTPKIQPVFAACTMLLSEAALGAAFPTTLVGTTSRTYISVGVAMGIGAPGATPNASICLIYE